MLLRLPAPSNINLHSQQSRKLIFVAHSLGGIVVKDVRIMIIESSGRY